MNNRFRITQCTSILTFLFICNTFTLSTAQDSKLKKPNQQIDEKSPGAPPSAKDTEPGYLVKVWFTEDCLDGFPEITQETRPNVVRYLSQWPSGERLAKEVLNGRSPYYIKISGKMRYLPLGQYQLRLHYSGGAEWSIKQLDLRLGSGERRKNQEVKETQQLGHAYYDYTIRYYSNQQIPDLQFDILRDNQLIEKQTYFVQPPQYADQPVSNDPLPIAQNKKYGISPYYAQGTPPAWEQAHLSWNTNPSIKPSLRELKDLNLQGTPFEGQTFIWEYSKEGNTQLYRTFHATHATIDIPMGQWQGKIKYSLRNYQLQLDHPAVGEQTIKWVESSPDYFFIHKAHLYRNGIHLHFTEPLKAGAAENLADFAFTALNPKDKNPVIHHIYKHQDSKQLFIAWAQPYKDRDLSCQLTINRAPVSQSNKQLWSGTLNLDIKKTLKEDWSASKDFVPINNKPNSLSYFEKKEKYNLLFDGKNLKGWRNYQSNTLSNGWTIEDQSIAFVEGKPSGDLIYSEMFDDFELQLEWKISKGGNSGIFYRATEETEKTYHNAAEMQVLDNACHKDGVYPSHRAGSNYDLHPAGVDPTLKPGEGWNKVRIIAKGKHITFYLNGYKTADFLIGSEDWQRRFKNSKFYKNEWMNYAQAETGHIGLQDQGDKVWYRNIRIKKIK